MATRKFRKFEVGGYTNEKEDSEALADENYGDGTTREQRSDMVRSISRTKPSSDLTEDDISDYGPRYGRGAAGSSETTTAPAAKKAPIVTKEQLAKRGMSLRDYMNEQQGLTRRGEPAMDTLRGLDSSRLDMLRGARKNENYSNEGRSGFAVKTAPKETTVEKTVVKTEAPASTSPRFGRASQGASTSPEQKGVTAAGQAAANEKRAKQREGMFDKNPIAEIFKSIRKRGEETQGYAKGGAVSASKRADGIAQRGKTRGKIC